MNTKLNRIFLALAIACTLVVVCDGCALFRKDKEPVIIVVPLNPTTPIAPIVINQGDPTPKIVTEDFVPTVIKAGAKYHFDGYAINNIAMIQLNEGSFVKEYTVVKKDEVAPVICYLLSDKIVNVDKTKGIQLKDLVKGK